MPEQTVRQWIEAFNRHDLDALLACMSTEVVFQPVRLYGSERTYIGHDGVTRWYERLIRESLSYSIEVEAVSMTADDAVLATGELCVQGVRHASPFWGVHAVDDELITAGHHYLTDMQMALRFGISTVPAELQRP